MQNEKRNLQTERLFWFTCDLANASTTIPATLVNVIPDKTLLPVTDRDSLARKNLVPEMVE